MQTPELNSGNHSQNSTNADSSKKDDLSFNMSLSNINLNLFKKLEDSIIAEKIETDSEDLFNNTFNKGSTASLLNQLKEEQVSRRSRSKEDEDQLLKKQSSNSYYEDISDEDEPDPNAGGQAPKSSQYMMSQDLKKKNQKRRVNTTSNKPVRQNLQTPQVCPPLNPQNPFNNLSQRSQQQSFSFITKLK